MNLLTEQQRKNALICLAKAPDEVILSAMVDYKAHMHRMEGVKRNFDATLTELNQTQFEERREQAVPIAVDQRGSGIEVNMLNTIHPTLDAKSLAAKTMLDKVSLAERQNVSPGASSITKIGANTTSLLLESLDVNVQPAKKFTEHLKLLWSRGEVKFDGQVFYL